MMKKINFKITNKLPIWCAVWAVIILAGLILFFALGGVNGGLNKENGDRKVAIVKYDQALTVLGDEREELRELCEDSFRSAGLLQVKEKTSDSLYGQMEFEFAKSASDAKIDSAWTKIQGKIDGNEKLNAFVITYSLETRTAHAVYGPYVARAVGAVAAIVAVAAVYLVIRYGLTMGIAAFCAAIADTLVTVALVIICRIPVTASLATAVVFAAFYSLLVHLLAFNALRSAFKDEKYQALSIEDGMEEAKVEGAKLPVLVSAISLVFFLLFAIFGGGMVRSFALTAIVAVVASCYSVNFVTPSLVVAFRKGLKKFNDARAEKRQLAKLEEEKARQAKRAGKKENEKSDSTTNEESGTND